MTWILPVWLKLLRIKLLKATVTPSDRIRSNEMTNSYSVDSIHIIQNTLRFIIFTATHRHWPVRIIGLEFIELSRPVTSLSLVSLWQARSFAESAARRTSRLFQVTVTVHAASESRTGGGQALAEFQFVVRDKVDLNLVLQLCVDSRGDGVCSSMSLSFHISDSSCICSYTPRDGTKKKKNQVQIKQTNKQNRKKTDEMIHLH